MPAVKPRFREIQESDVEAIADLLTRGFVHRSRDYWMRGLRRQGARSLPPDAPRYGYLMENDGKPVGCLLLIYSTRTIDGQAAVCCNNSSWYVDPEFRNYAALFASMTQKRKDVTYFNVTPATPTWPILEAQGFKIYCRGLYFLVSRTVSQRSGHARRGRDAGHGLHRRPAGRRTWPAQAPRRLRLPQPGLPHGDRGHPLHFLSLRKRRGIIPLPALQLGFCREITDYVRCAGAIGRYLLWRGSPIVILDANGPIAGVAGVYSEARGRKYFKGPQQPRLGDLADTELAIFGM